MNVFEKYEKQLERIVVYAKSAATAVGDEEFAAECAMVKDALDAQYGWSSEETPKLSVTCPICGTQSWRKQHIEQGYCPKCHEWFAHMYIDTERKIRLECYAQIDEEHETESISMPSVLLPKP